MQHCYDILIIGAGPIGLACAIEAEKNELNYRVIEKGALVNSLYHYPLFMTFFSTAERLEVGNIPFTSVSFKPGRQEALEYYRNIHRHFGFNINFYEKAGQVTKGADGLFTVTTSKDKYKAKAIIIATGFYDIPVYLNIPGENLPKVSHYYKEAHPYCGQKLVIIGANNSAVDAALECWRKGAEVTMVLRGSGIHKRVKYWVKPDIENRIEEGSIKTYFNSVVQEIKQHSVIIKSGNGQIELPNDFVLALTGYRPDFEMLQQCGIQLSADGLFTPSYNPDTMESNVNGLYLAGVVCGGMETHKWFIENSREHAAIIFRHILLQKNN
ncbi:MAG: YpdA family putative bacillithiol disulfide reductase [Chitinophagaceae bacterium]|nr:YpdA family putative bacillithiol disulfide reductase [Chitinophagaceae bacterium]